VTTSTLTALDVLEERAGASDQDRDAWLAERRQGVTATEIRDLYLKKISARELIDRKLGRIPEIGDLSYVPVIGWGKHREPIIAAIIQERYGLRPETRVFRATDNPRYLASPDGVGANFDDELIVAEIKTAGHDVSIGTTAYADKGYQIQQLWVMRVTGARRSLYAWEERLEVAPNTFEAGELRFGWVEYDEKLVAKLERVADRFLADLDKAAAGPYEAPEIDDELDTLAVNYLRFLGEETAATEAKKNAWAGILAKAKSQTGQTARVTFTPASTVESDVESIDYDAARAADAALFEQMNEINQRWSDHCEQFKTTATVTTTRKASLRVTAVKVKEPADG
jgi:hypothetical protein